MNGEWCYCNERLPAETCQRIIADATAGPCRDATIGISNAVDQGRRRSKVWFVQEQDTRFKDIFNHLWQAALMANRDWFGFHITHLEYLQIAEYRAEYKGEYRRHQDVFWCKKEEPRHRKLSCIVQLSDPKEYDGGDLEFYDVDGVPDKIAMRQQGTVIFFPSFVYHAAMPVTRGVRHSIAAWFEGPKWR